MNKNVASHWIRNTGVIFLLALAVGLQGCGGGGGGSTTVTNADPTGYYDLNGTAMVKSDYDGITPVTLTNLQAIAYNNRILMMTSDKDGILYDISISTISGNSFTGTAKIYYLSVVQLVKIATVSGTITAGSTITGTLTGDGSGDGTFSLTYNNQMAAIPTIATNWGLPIALSSTKFIFTTDGVGGLTNTATISDGLYFNNCSLNSGTVTELGTSKLYSVAVTVAGCTDTSVNGAYTGLAAAQDASASALALAIVSADGKHSLSGGFVRQ